jgi:hypothetical protein
VDRNLRAPQRDCLHLDNLRSTPHKDRAPTDGNQHACAHIWQVRAPTTRVVCSNGSSRTSPTVGRSLVSAADRATLPLHVMFMCAWPKHRKDGFDPHDRGVMRGSCTAWCRRAEAARGGGEAAGHGGQQGPQRAGWAPGALWHRPHDGLHPGGLLHHGTHGHGQPHGRCPYSYLFICICAGGSKGMLSSLCVRVR